MKVKGEAVELKEGEGEIQLEEENRRLRRKVEELEEQVAVMGKWKVEEVEVLGKRKVEELEEEVSVQRKRKVEELEEELAVMRARKELEEEVQGKRWRC